MRIEGRENNQTRQVKFTRNYTKHALGLFWSSLEIQKLLRQLLLRRVSRNGWIRMILEVG